MSEEGVFSKKFHYEEQIYNLLVLAIPFILGFIIFLIFASNYNEFPPWTLLIPLCYLPFYLVFYERKLLDWNRVLSTFSISPFFNFESLEKRRSSKYFFDKIGFPDAVIRIVFIEKIFKYSLPALIVVGLFAVISLHAMNITENENLKNYENKKTLYETELQATLNLGEAELRSYYQEKIVKMSDYKVRYLLSSIIQKQIERDATSSGDTKMFDNASKIADHEVFEINDDMLKTEAIKSVQTLSYDELKTRTDEYVADLKPEYQSDLTFYFNLIQFLFAMSFIPGMMFYSASITIRSLKNRSDFHYQYAINCFRIVIDFKELQDIYRRKYILLGIKHYDKYLIKTLAMRINNLDLIISSSLKNDSVHLYSNTSQMLTELSNDNKLALLNFLSKDIAINNTPILVTDTARNRIVELSKFIIPIITTFLSILSLILQKI